MVKVCNYCGREKKLDSFHNLRTSKDGKAARCKICVSEISRKYKKNISRELTPRLSNVRKKDWCDTYRFLQQIGYDLSRNIHEQFCEKNNLPLKKRKVKDKVKMWVSPSDCGY